MKALFSLCVPVFIMTVIFACKKEDTTTTPVVTTTNYTATLNGAQEKPTSTTSTGTGSFVGRLDNTTRVLNYTVTYSGLTTTAATGGHIHRITDPTSSTGPVVVPFATGTTSSTVVTLAASPIVGTTTLRQSLIDSMNAGQTYVNIHTSRYPGGEIRGDIKK